MSVSRQLLKKVMAGLLPRDRFMVSGPTGVRHSNGQQQSPCDIALTFDDGPHPEWTPAVLDALAQASWKGTFFVIGERAAEHPDLLRRIVAEGHVVGNHSFTHSDPKLTSAAEFHAEVCQTNDLIQQLTGQPVDLMRPPMGDLNIGKFRALWRDRQSIVLWNIDPEDFAMSDDSQPRRWAEAYAPHPGDVILLHDRLQYAAEIVRALSTIHGDTLRSVTISDWMPRLAQPHLSEQSRTAVSR